MKDLSFVDVVDLLESTGVRNVKVSGKEVNFSCPLPAHKHGDQSPSARMNKATTATYCHGCHFRGNAVTFLAAHKQLPAPLALRLLEERYGGSGAPIGDLCREVKRIMAKACKESDDYIGPDESWITKFTIDWFAGVHKATGKRGDFIPYMLGRRFSPDFLSIFEIGYDVLSGRLTIPIRDHTGKLVGFKARSWRETQSPKYLILGDRPDVTRYGFSPYKKSKVVFGLDDIAARGQADKLYICEGEFNAIAMREHGYRDSVAISGSEFSDKQCELITRYARSAVLYFDDDEAGRRGTSKVVKMLSPHIPISVITKAPGDAADLDTQVVKQLVSRAQTALALAVRGEI